MASQPGTVLAPDAELRAAFDRLPRDGTPGVIPYITAGFPRLGDTVAILQEFEAAGCVAAEIGVPHTDPLADGPTIQAAGAAAIRNGITLPLMLEQAQTARKAGVSIPLIVMTYYNPIHAFGVERFVQTAVQSGINGIIVPDLPLGESREVRALCRSVGVAFIPMVAPTTTDQRLAESCREAPGFVYCVSVTGTTGARDAIAQEAFCLLARVRNVSSVPRALGFGISRHVHLEQLSGSCEAVIVASALLDEIRSVGSNAAITARRFLERMIHGER